MLRGARHRRSFLLGGVGMLAGSAPLRQATAQTNDYAIFSEFSPASKAMQPGWNRRVFTTVESRKGNAIQCDLATGVVTLAPGTWHLSGFSMVVYNDPATPGAMAPIRSPAVAGYCRLRTFDPAIAVDPGDLFAIRNNDPSVICVGSPSTANMTPSLFDAFHEASRTTQMLLEHQAGTAPDGVYLRVFAENSSWHAFARISIRRLV